MKKSIISFIYNEWSHAVRQYRTAFLTVFGMMLAIVLMVSRFIVDVSTHSVFSAALAVCVVVFCIVASKHNVATKIQKPQEKKYSIAIYALSTLCVLAFALFQSLPGLGTRNFHNDEFYHVEAAQGYIETGRFVQWDFTHNTVRTHPDGSEMRYTRSAVYTWQVAQSIRLFGFSEWSARLPSVFWYCVIAVVALFCFTKITQRIGVASVATYALLSLSNLIAYSQLVRMYTMTVAVALCMVVAAWYVLDLFYKAAWSWRALSLRSGIFVALCILGYMTHVQTLILIPGIIFAFCMEWLIEEFRARKNKKYFESAKRLRSAVIILACCGIVSVLTLLYGGGGLLQRLFVWRSTPNTAYLLYPFYGFASPYLTACFFLLGVLIQLIRTRSVRFVSSILIVGLVVLIFYINRYPAERYSLYLVPLIFLNIVAIYAAWTSSIGSRLLRFSLASLFVLVFMPLHITVFAPIQELTRFSSAYAFVREISAHTDVLYTVDFRSYYWQNDPARVIVELGHNKSLTLTEFQEIVRTHGAGYMILPKGKTRHVSREIRTYCDEHFFKQTVQGVVIYTLN